MDWQDFRLVNGGDYINVSVYIPLVGSSYTKLPKELRHSRIGLINISIKIMNVFDGVTLDT